MSAKEKWPRKAILGDTQTLLANPVDSNLWMTILALFPYINGDDD
jgi:hypothetical protein